MLPKSWTIFYADNTTQKIKADNISPAGTLLMFIKQTGLTDDKGQVQGFPIAFIDMANENVHSVVADEPDDAAVLSLA
jgi:hypothetical protein